jgi:hypothetical protein
LVRSLHHAAARWGFPESFLTDNGLVFSTQRRHDLAGAVEVELLALGITGKHSRPYHPQTCGKVERFHQTVKKFLANQDPAETKKQLQAQLDRFARYCNTVRPQPGGGTADAHGGVRREEKAYPSGPRIDVSGYRVRRDRVDKGGGVTLRYHGRLHHIGIGRAYKGWRVILLVAGRQVQVIGVDGSQLRRAHPRPEHRLPAHPLRRAITVYDVPTHLSRQPMSRDITPRS